MPSNGDSEPIPHTYLNDSDFDLLAFALTLHIQQTADAYLGTEMPREMRSYLNRLARIVGLVWSRKHRRKLARGFAQGESNVDVVP